MQGIFTSVPLPSVGELLKLYRLRASKQLSQNFLLDLNITNKFVRNVGNLNKAEVCEVGPGPGGITRCIIGKNPSKLIVIEKDKRFKNLLEILGKASPVPFQAYYSDILDFDLSSLFSEDKKKNWDDFPPNIFLIGNLPFSVSTPLIIQWIKDISLKRSAWTYGRVRMGLAFQEEVAQRIVSPILSKSRCRLSVMCQNWCKTEYKFKIPSRAFVPRPEVDAALVTFEPLSQPIINLEFELVEKVVRTLFNGRQKFMKNNIKNLFPKECQDDLTQEIFNISKLDPTMKPYKLNLEEIGSLCTAYKSICDRDPRIYHYNYRESKVLKEFTWKMYEDEKTEDEKSEDEVLVSSQS